MHEQAGYAIKYHVVVIFPTRAEQFKQQYKKQKTKNKKQKQQKQQPDGQVLPVACCVG